MGWAGPAQPTGPDSAPKVLGRSRPKMDWADLGPTKSDMLFWARPGPEGRAGPGPAWPSNKTGRGGIVPPPTLLHAERYSFCMQGTKQNATMKGEEELPGAEEAVRRWSVGFAGGAAAALFSFLPFASVWFFSQLFVLLCVQWSPLSIVPSLSHCFPSSSLSAPFFFSLVLFSSVFVSSFCFSRGCC